MPSALEVHLDQLEKHLSRVIAVVDEQQMNQELWQQASAGLSQSAQRHELQRALRRLHSVIREEIR